MTPDANQQVGDDLEFGKRKLTEQAEQVALRQVQRLITLSRTELHGRPNDLRPVFYSIGGTCVAISVLCRGGFLNEATMVMRGLLERVVNTAFALRSPPDEYERYLRHQPGAGYAEWDQLAAKPPDQVHAYPDLDMALRRFSRESGRWTDLSLRQRIKACTTGDQREAVLFLSAALMLYGEGSEALHGSFYGCTMFMGSFKDSSGGTLPLEAVFHRKHAFIYLTIAHLIAALLRALAREVDIEHLASEVNDDEERVEKLIRAALGRPLAMDMDEAETQ